MSEQENLPDRSPDHWQLLRDVFAFQFKLLMDGVRDILLSPISIGAAILGVVFSPNNPGKYFSGLLKFGLRTDRWINLFGATIHYEEGEPSADLYVNKVEAMIKREYDKGGVIKSMKDQTDSVFDKIRNDKPD